MIMFTCIKKFLKKSGMTRSVMEMYVKTGFAFTNERTDGDNS